MMKPNVCSRHITLILATLASLYLTTGCAKGPAGGPLGAGANDQMIISMTLAQPLNPVFYYDFAFNDTGNSAVGPIAIVGTTTLPNGVVGGAFTVLVQYHGGQFLCWRRTDLGNGNETLDPCTSAFVVPPSPAFGTNISFTLNLDAKTNSGANLFTPNTQLLDVNFVTTSTIIRDPNNLNRKPFDAFGPFLSGFWWSIDIRGNQTYTNSQMSPTEITGDVFNDGSLSPSDLSSLDIADFSIQILRLS